ncbi:MAG: family peptidase [Burkholderiales bacterium]|jgi:protease-4|nr:family peptidase [Burkholderiales bacterium]
MDTWEKSTLEKVLLETIKEQRRSRRWRVFFRIIWLIIIGAILFNVFGGRSKLSAETGKHVAIVNLNSVISDENKSYETVIDGVTSALEDKDTVGVIIRANSPGGSPVYSNMIYNEILRLRKLYPKKPIDVVIEDVCASGCYYIAAAAEKIYANPSSIVGSIGVIYTGFGVTNLMDKVGVDSRLIISGRNKAMGYPFIPPNAEQNAMQQQMLDKIHMQFITAVKNGRGNKLSNDPDLFSGRYWIGEDAKPLGLIDGFSTVDGLARDQFKTDNLVDYTPDSDPVDRIAKKLGVGLVDWAKQQVLSPQFGKFN